MKKSRVFNQIVEGLTVHMEFLDIATVESKAFKNFPDISFTFRWFQIFQVFYSFCNGLDSFRRYSVTKKLKVLLEEECFVGSYLETFFPKKGMVLVDYREHLILVQWLHYSIVRVGDCLLFLDERIKINRHQSAKEVWKPAQPIKSTCVGVLFSTNYETTYFLCFRAQRNLMISKWQILYWEKLAIDPSRVYLHWFHGPRVICKICHWVNLYCINQ